MWTTINFASPSWSFNALSTFFSTHSFVSVRLTYDSIFPSGRNEFMEIGWRESAHGNAANAIQRQLHIFFIIYVPTILCSENWIPRKHFSYICAIGHPWAAYFFFAFASSARTFSFLWSDSTLTAHTHTHATHTHAHTHLHFVLRLRLHKAHEYFYAFEFWQKNKPGFDLLSNFVTDSELNVLVTLGRENDVVACSMWYVSCLRIDLAQCVCVCTVFMRVCGI